MKQFLFNSIIATFAILSGAKATAQNNIDLKWGYFLPVNNQLHQSFSNPRSFSIALMHPIPKSKFEAGIKFSHERYVSKNNQAAGINNITIHHYLISGRYDLVEKEAYNIFTMADAGINRSKKYETKNGIINATERAGATIGLGIGIETKISDRLLLGYTIQTQYSYTDDILYDYFTNADPGISVIM